MPATGYNNDRMMLYATGMDGLVQRKAFSRVLQVPPGSCSFAVIHPSHTWMKKTKLLQHVSFLQQ